MPLLALCVGVSNYARIGKLPGALNDLGAVVRKCEALGFEVTSMADIGNDNHHDAVEAFVRRVSSGDTVFVFFTGHGLQFFGDHYFVPFDYGTRGTPDPPWHEFPVYAKLIKELEGLRTRLIYIALHACRDETIL